MESTWDNINIDRNVRADASRAAAGYFRFRHAHLRRAYVRVPVLLLLLPVRPTVLLRQESPPSDTLLRFSAAGRAVERECAATRARACALARPHVSADTNFGYRPCERWCTRIFMVIFISVTLSFMIVGTAKGYNAFPVALKVHAAVAMSQTVAESGTVVAGRE